MGEIDGDGGEGDPSGSSLSGEPDVGSEPERATERGVSAQGNGVRAEAGNQAERGWGQRDFAGAAEPVADCGAAGERGDGAGVFGCIAAAGGRGGASERR